MLTVTHKNQIEPLNQINGFEMNEEVNGALTVSFTSFSIPNNPGHVLLEEESLIDVEGYEFRVKQMKESDNRKSITALSSYFDNAGVIRTETYGGTHTLYEFVTFALTGTGWTFTVQGSLGSIVIPNFGNENSVKLISQICAAFECEFQIMPNKHLIFAKEIGPNNDFQYRYTHNVKTLSKSVDTSNMKMSITAYGSEGLVVKYTSPNASKFPHLGEAEPVHDERFTIAENLLKKAKDNLIDYPETIIELDTVDVTDRALGERVWLIYEPLDLEYQTRVMSKKSVLRNGKIVTATATIGNIVPRDLSDILTQQKVEIDENKKETRSRFEQTNDRITLEVETINESIATIDIKADNIILSVEAVERSVAMVDIKADSISFSVSQLGSRVNGAESQLSIQAGQISSKVSQTDYNGNVITSLINQTASSIKINAKNIELDGITQVNEVLNIGAPGTFGSKLIAFSNNTGISTFDSVAMNIRAEGDIQFSTNSSVDFRDVGNIYWGNNAPAARFG